MALSSDTTGAAIAAYVQSNVPSGEVTAAQLEALWKGIMNIIYTDLKTNMTILPGSFIAPSGGGPVSGAGGPAL